MIATGHMWLSTFQLIKMKKKIKKFSSTLNTNHTLQRAQMPTWLVEVILDNIDTDHFTIVESSMGSIAINYRITKYKGP